MDQFCFTPAKNEEKTWADHGTVNWVLTAIQPLKQTIIFNFLPMTIGLLRRISKRRNPKYNSRIQECLCNSKS